MTRLSSDGTPLLLPSSLPSSGSDSTPTLAVSPQTTVSLHKPCSLTDQCHLTLRPLHALKLPFPLTLLFDARSTHNPPPPPCLPTSFSEASSPLFTSCFWASRPGGCHARFSPHSLGTIASAFHSPLQSLSPCPLTSLSLAAAPSSTLTLVNLAVLSPFCSPSVALFSGICE